MKREKANELIHTTVINILKATNYNLGKVNISDKKEYNYIVFMKIQYLYNWKYIFKML
jgi:hypothetical protein